MGWGETCYLSAKERPLQQFDTASHPEAITASLKNLGWLEPGEKIRTVSKAGEGNMNVVLRLGTNRRSLILKQSRPFVQKYPQIPAPPDRICTEEWFYRAVAGSGIEAHLPGVLGFDPDSYLMLLEDLGQAEDMTFLYEERTVARETLQTLVEVLGRIHATPAPAGFPDNLELRRLNHQHIFVLPFLKDNGFNLDQIQPGLEALATPFKKDAALKAVVTALGHHYLEAGKVLLHGDYYPGSWLQASGTVYIIDPEFSFAGFAEFDLGVMAGHLLLATGDPEIVNRVLERYSGPANRELAVQVAGAEIVRRLIGLAQLPLERSLEEKAYLLGLARNFLLHAS